jgi:hypothetical protein
MKRAVIAGALLGVVAVAVTGSTAAAPTKSTAVSIESRVRGNTVGTSHKGTFKLVGNFVDSGTVSATVDNFRAGKRDGQPYELIQTTDTYKSKRGTLTIRTRDSIGVSAGYDHSVITGTWVVVGGTGVYQGASGRGRAASVVLPARGTSITSVSRLQGILKTP